MVIKYKIILLMAVVGWGFASLPQNHVLDLDAYFEALDDLPDSQERVVGGSTVGTDEYVPYQISMQYSTQKGPRHFCGGSIIAPNRILTAAHCVNGQDPSKLSVVAGINNLDEKNGPRSKVESFDIHENYKELETSDIAILKIEPPFELDGKRINKIDVFGYDSVGGKQSVRLTGWGSVHHFGNGPLARYPTALQTLKYVTMTNDECKRTMRQLTDTEICAKSRFGQGACNGDSGGPLVMEQDGIYKQVGVVSYGTAFCASNSPDVYTRTTMFEDWVKERKELSLQGNVFSNENSLPRFCWEVKLLQLKLKN